MPPSRRIAAWPVLVALFAAACAGVPTTHYYTLQLRPEPPGAAGAASPSAARIGVRPFRVDAPFDQDRIVYRIGEDAPEVGFYAYHRWAAPLSRMLAQIAARSLGGVQGRVVEPAVAGRDYAAFVEGRLLALEEIDTAQGQQVRVELVLSLHSPGGEELWSRTVAGRATTSTESVGQVVRQMGEVLGRSLETARPEMARALARLL